MDLSFYNGKRVFVTGHTGFKGSWLCRLLSLLGAEVTGYALKPETDPNLFDISGIEHKINSNIGDIRDFSRLKDCFDSACPEIVFHLAAQPIVRESYINPKYTFETNVTGTVNLLECIRLSDSVRSFLNVTTDKVYENRDDDRSFKEEDKLCGFDPYSNSKSCSELVTYSYNASFLAEKGVAVSTARAGNVIGGGDYAADRIIPDCVRAAEKGGEIIVRNPYSVRPFQFVIEPLLVYLMIAKKQYEDAAFAGCYNVGPDLSDCIETGELTELFCAAWGNGLKWKHIGSGGPHEAKFLRLDCSKLKNTFGWQPVWDVEKAVGAAVDFSKALKDGENAGVIMDRQIKEFLAVERNTR